MAGSLVFNAREEESVIAEEALQAAGSTTACIKAWIKHNGTEVWSSVLYLDPNIHWTSIHRHSETHPLSAILHSNPRRDGQLTWTRPGCPAQAHKSGPETRSGPGCRCRVGHTW